MKDLLALALKAYGGPAGLIGEVSRLAESNQELFEDRAAKETDPQKRQACEQLARYWREIQDALNDPEVEQKMDRAEGDAQEKLARLHGGSPWRLDPERLILRPRKAR